MSRTIERLRRQASWADPRATVRAWMRGVATAVLLMFVAPSPGAAASDWVLQALLSEDAATVGEAVPKLYDALYGPSASFPWTAESVGALFRDDVDVASWFGEVLARGLPDAREAAGWSLLLFSQVFFFTDLIEFAAENHRSAEEIFQDWPEDNWFPTMEDLRSQGDSFGLLADLSETVPDDEARRLALAFASQMKRVQAALPRFIEEEHDRRRRSGTIGSDEVLDLLLHSLAPLQRYVGTEEARVAAWTRWMEEREAQGLPTKVVGVEAPWNLFGMGIAYELGESDIPVAGRKLAPGVRRAALALTAEPAAEPWPGARGKIFEGEETVDGLEAAVALLANERPLAEEAGRRIFDLYCGSPDGDCFEKLNLLYAGPDDPSLRSIEEDVGKRVVESLVGLLEEKERHCDALAECDDADCTTVLRVMSKAESLNLAQRLGPDLREASIGSSEGAWRLAEGETQFRLVVSVRERIGSIGEELQEVLALVERLDTVPRPILDSVFEFWSTERFPEARRILEKNDWLGPEATAVASASSAQRVGSGAGPGPSRRIGVAELCEGRL